MTKEWLSIKLDTKRENYASSAIVTHPDRYTSIDYIHSFGFHSSRHGSTWHTTRSILIHHIYLSAAQLSNRALKKIEINFKRQGTQLILC